MSKVKKLIYILLVMLVYLILIFIHITPKISFKGRVNGIEPKDRVYIYSGENIRLTKIDEYYTGIISPNVIELSPGVHEIKAEYKKGKTKGVYYFEPYNYPAGTKVIIVAKKDSRGELTFDLKLGEILRGKLNIFEYIFYIISTLIASVVVFNIIKEVKIMNFYERKTGDSEGAVLKTTEDIYIEKINRKKVNAKILKVPEGKYTLDVVYSKKNGDSFFSKKTYIIFSDVEVEIYDKDVLSIGYLIENKKMRLDFNLNQE